tara:strand:+ start:845 stop:2173 length:1329 start_codon:yes stop_codon:yes gene_type:complete
MFNFASLATSFGGFIWIVFFFVLALSVIVTVHEYGHYIVGRWCGIHAEVFSVGFGSVLLSKLDKRGTRWQIAALPFGGYVKFKGDANVASGPDWQVSPNLSPIELRRTMHGAPVWARAATAAAGPAFNFIFSTILFCVLFMWQGQFTDAPKISKMFPTPTMNTLQIGDEIISVNGLDVSSIEDLVIVGKEIVAPAFYTVLRDKRHVQARGPVPFPALVSQVQPRSAAIEAGIKIGDVIVSIDGQKLNNFADLQAAVAAADADAMLFSVWRGGSEFDISLTSRLVATPTLDGSFENRRLIGITGGIFFEPGTEPLPFGIALNAALKRTWYIITVSLAGIKEMVFGKISACNLSGPVAIAETAGQIASQGTMPFLALIAGLSTAIGLMNLFPIPVLDGGHLVFCAYEAITGRKPSDPVQQILMTLGLVAILSLTLFAIVINEIC